MSVLRKIHILRRIAIGYYDHCLREFELKFEVGTNGFNFSNDPES